MEISTLWKHYYKKSFQLTNFRPCVKVNITKRGGLHLESQDLQKLEEYILQLREKCQNEEAFKDKLRKLPIEYLEIIKTIEKKQLENLLYIVETGEF